MQCRRQGCLSQGTARRLRLTCLSSDSGKGIAHLLAFALVDEFADRENADELFAFAAGGFRDFTRIASSHPEMWRDICVANRHALLTELDAYMIQLMHARVMLASADASGLEAMFASARLRRELWLEPKASGNG